MMKITKDTMLAYVDGTSMEVVEVLAEGKTDIKAILDANVRAEPQYGMEASHVTNTTRKYQCNADLRYASAIRKLRSANELSTDGAAIRMVLEAGLKALGYKELVDEVVAEREGGEE